MNKPPAEHQGHIFYPSKSFAALQNLVRLSLQFSVKYNFKIFYLNIGLYCSLT